MTRWLLHTALVGTGMALTAGPASAQQGGRISFTKDVLPIFQKRCQNCHGVGDRGGLKLDTLDNVLQGGAKGEIIIRGNPDQSSLMQYLDGRRKPQMPVGGTPLTRTERAVIGAWIQQGAQGDDGAAGMAVKPLELAEPKDGSDVKEKVKLVVPREGIPPGGFVAVYIDDKFRVALAPPSEADLEEQGKAADSPLEYVWNTKAALTDDSSALAAERFLADGPHVVEIRSYDANGSEIERVKAQVNLRNTIDAVTNKPIRLIYGGDPSRLGRSWIYEHNVELEANSSAPGFGRTVRGARAGIQQQSTGGPDKIKHKELTKYLVSLEDLVPSSGTGFYRERREGPIVVNLDNVKHVVRVDASSRYYSMERTGNVLKSKLMEREAREPIVNPLDLPGRAHRMNEPFTTNLRVHLGAYIPASLNIDRLQATIEGMEWQNGEQCAKIRLTYVAGTGKVDINSVNIKGADFQVIQGNTTIWFSEATNRVIRAKHEITGNLMVDTNQFAAGGGVGGYPGGEGIPGEGAYPGSESPYPGAAPGGYPGAMPGGPGAAYGAPFGGPMAGAYPGSSPGSSYGAPTGAYPGAPGGAYPGSSGGYPGAAPGGYPGAEGAYPGAAPGGGTGLPGPKLKRYHVTLKVNTIIADETK